MDVPSREAGLIAPSPQQLLELLYVLPVGVLEFEADGRVLSSNPRVVQMLFPHVGGAAMTDALAMLRPIVPDLCGLLARHPAPGPLVSARRRLFDPTGQLIVIEAQVHRIRDHFVAILVDVTEQAEAQRRLRQEEDRYRTIVETVRGYAIYSVDLAGVVDSWNESARRVLGVDEGGGRPLAELISANVAVPALLDCVRDTGWQCVEGWIETPSGEKRWLDTLISSLGANEPAGSPAGFVVVSRDRTDEHLHQLDLEQAALHDPLTGLRNRRGFKEYRKQISATPGPHCVLMLDLDHFKSVNDTHGHDVGDQVLVAVAQILRQQTRAGDEPGRLGGEEFAVVMTETAPRDALIVAERIRGAVETARIPVGDGQVLRVTASIGVAAVDGSLHDALRWADEALYVAKDCGRNRVVLADEASRAA